MIRYIAKCRVFLFKSIGKGKVEPDPSDEIDSNWFELGPTRTIQSLLDEKDETKRLKPENNTIFMRVILPQDSRATDAGKIKLIILMSTVQNTSDTQCIRSHINRIYIR